MSGSGLEDALAEYDELTVEGMLREMLDKAIACDDISVSVVEGPNTLEDYDEIEGYDELDGGDELDEWEDDSP